MLSARQFKPPSIILVVVDTLRYDALGFNGSGNSASRKLDAVAKRGVIFDRAISQASWTRSSMASLVTGLYPRRVGVIREQWDALPGEAELVSERLKEAGYQTIGITANPQLNNDFHFNQGFDFYQECKFLFPWMRPSANAQYTIDDTSALSAGWNLRIALAQIKKRDKKRPVFLQALLMDVHEYGRIGSTDISPDLREFPNAGYLESVRRGTDKIVEFITKVDEELEGDVVFIITSDHGEGLLDHPSVPNSWSHGNLLYSSSIHVPLLFLEGSARNNFVIGRRQQLSELIDVVPTIFEIAGIEYESKSLNGNSLLPILLGRKPLGGRKVAFSETQWRPGIVAKAVVSDQWLYVVRTDSWPGTDPEELQSLSRISNGRMTNVAKDYPDVVISHRNDLTTLEAVADRNRDGHIDGNDTNRSRVQ